MSILYGKIHACNLLVRRRIVRLMLFFALVPCLDGHKVIQKRHPVRFIPLIQATFIYNPDRIA